MDDAQLLAYLDTISQARRNGVTDGLPVDDLYALGERLQAENLQKKLATLTGFCAEVSINKGSEVIPFRDLAEKWQLQEFAALDRPWQAVLTGESSGDKSRAWIERPRGHSKTSDVALMATWALFAAKRQISGVAAAADRDQAKLLRDQIDKVVKANEWVAERLEVQTYRIINKLTGSALHIISSDAATSYGTLADFVIVDEISHWPDRGKELWNSLFSTAAKHPHCLLLVITNAGYSRMWQWQIMKTVRDDRRWHYSHLDGPQASWISKEDLAEQRRMLPSNAYRRLWLNEWVEEMSEALDAELIEQAVDDSLGPMIGDEPGWTFVAGLDLGISHDHAALVVVGVHHAESKIRLAYTRAWQPHRKTKEVNLQDVENVTLGVCRQFRTVQLRYDPYQAKLMAQRLTTRGVWCEECPFVGKNLMLMASSMIEVFRDSKFRMYRDERLIRDLHRLAIVEKQYGWKLEATRDVEGHADVATALAIALPRAVEFLRDVLTDEQFQAAGEEDSRKEFTPEEVEKLPDFLRELVEGHAELKATNRFHRYAGKMDDL